ncbi:hypothetical protein ACHAWF_016900 [Thalassiosira exigua]
MHRHQRIHHSSRRSSPHDAPPRHAPPHDPRPRYEYHTSLSSSAASRAPCPICGAPPASFHGDDRSGDLVCTRCGAVLDDRLRDASAEWRDYNNDEDLIRGRGGKRSRCGEVVDEGRWAGGVMPTTVSATAYAGGGGGGGGGAGRHETSEERRKLAALRSGLKRTHNVVEHMLEQERKARHAEVALELRARDARIRRGESTEVDEARRRGESEGGIEVDGDYEGLLAQREEQGQDGPFVPLGKNGSSNAKTPPRGKGADAPLRDEKWSLPDATVLCGSLDQVREWAHAPPPTDGGEWTEGALEAARAALAKKSDAGALASLRKLYAAFAVLERAATKLQLHGPADRAFREAVSWLLQFASETDGLRVRGISSGASSSSGGKKSEASALSLSLLGSDALDSVLGASASASGKRAKGAKSPSLSAELHRLRQYAALGSAILYLSAKRSGVGRTLTEVCSAFGTYRIDGNDNGSGNSNNNHNGVDHGAGEPLVRPKHCSKAMQELRAALPEIVAPPTTAAGASGAEPGPATKSSGPGAEERKPGPAEVTPTYDAARASAVQSERVPEARDDGGSDAARSAAEAALADLTSRVATSLGLPPDAARAAAAAAVRCARDARGAAASSPPPAPKKRGGGGGSAQAHIRPSRRRRQRGSGAAAAPRDVPDEVVAASSLLLVCRAGGTMGRLAPQALAGASAPSSPGGEPGGAGDGDEKTAEPSDPRDEWEDVASASAAVPLAPVPDAAGSASGDVESERRAPPSWSAWRDQPPWRRDASQIERSAGVSREAIVAHYASAVHPRRSRLLDAAERGLAEAGGRLRGITAAAPLLSLRDL